MKRDQKNDYIKWKEKLEAIASTWGLGVYPQNFEWLAEEDFLLYKIHHGRPLQLPQWKLSKMVQPFYLWEREELLYRKAICILPPKLYMLESNSLGENLFSMIHACIYSDFVMNNQSYQSIGDLEESLKMWEQHHTFIVDSTRNSFSSIFEVKKTLQLIRSMGIWEDAFLRFLTEEGKIPSWKKTLMEIFMKESTHLMAYLETMLLYRAWAGFWFHKLLRELELPLDLEKECLRLQKALFPSGKEKISLGRLGELLLQRIFEDGGRDKIFEVRRIDNDRSFFEKYLDVSGHEKFGDFLQGVNGDLEAIKSTLLSYLGKNRFPHIRFEGVRSSDGTLLLEHVFDGRELQPEYVFQILRDLVGLWGHKVILRTKFNGVTKLVLCDEEQAIAIKTEGK